jgi:hypothetical protein
VVLVLRAGIAVLSRRRGDALQEERREKGRERTRQK